MIYTVEIKEKVNQSTEQVSPRLITIKGDLKLDDPEKKEDEIGSEKIFKKKQKYLKRIRKKIAPKQNHILVNLG